MAVAPCLRLRDPAAPLKASTQEAEMLTIVPGWRSYVRAGTYPPTPCCCPAIWTSLSTEPKRRGHTSIFRGLFSSFCNASHTRGVNPDLHQYRGKVKPVVF